MKVTPTGCAATPSAQVRDDSALEPGLERGLDDERDAAGKKRGTKMSPGCPAAQGDGCWAATEKTPESS